MSFLNRELAIVGESQYGKTYLNNLFLQEAYRKFGCYQKRPLVINPYKKEDYRNVSFSFALLRGGSAWSHDLKIRVENRLVALEDLSLIKKKEAHSRLEDMFKRRRFDLVTVAQDFLGIRNVIDNIKLFALFGLKNQKLFERAVRSVTAIPLQEKLRFLKPREYVILDNQTKHVSEIFANDNVDPLLFAFKNGLNEAGELYASPNPVRQQSITGKSIREEVLKLKLEHISNADIALKLNKTQNDIAVIVFKLKEKGLLPNVDGRVKNEGFKNYVE